MTTIKIEINPNGQNAVRYEKGYYVYRFLNKYGEILYVGRTTNNLKTRINQHFSKGHLGNDCYKNVDKIEYINLNGYTEMAIYEIYYINKFKPLYNDKHSYEDDESISLPEKKWFSFYTDNDKVFDIINTVEKLDMEVGRVNMRITSFIDDYKKENAIDNKLKILLDTLKKEMDYLKDYRNSRISTSHRRSMEIFVGL